MWNSVFVDQVTMPPKEYSTTWNGTEKGNENNHTALAGEKALKGTSVLNENKRVDVTKEERKVFIPFHNPCHR